MPLFPYELIDTTTAWKACLHTLRREPRLAVDVEANSLHAYRERVCLVQVSVPGHDYIIDPLAGVDLSGLGEILAKPSVEKVFHSCEYDLMMLKRHQGWTVSNIFDTMWAGRILGFTNMGLAWFLRHFYEVELSKKYQKADWARRPLSEAELNYAQCDTHYLLRLRDELAAQLDAAGRTTEAKEIFANACHVDVPVREFTPEGFWTLPGARLLPGRDQAILKALYVCRDQEAQRRDVPPFKVLGNDALLALAQRAPGSLQELDGIDGLSRRQIQHLGVKLLRAIEEGKKAPLPTQGKRARRHTSEVSNRYNRLQEWRKHAAQERGVESDVILSRDILWAIAESDPKTLDELEAVPGLGDHRRTLYGEEILRELAERQPAEEA